MPEESFIFDPRAFISPPYLDCPFCHTDGEFGVLMINDSGYVRRCRKCMESQGFQLPPIEKKVLYLDQFAVSNLMKVLHPQERERLRKHPGGQADFWLELFERLDRLLVQSTRGRRAAATHSLHGQLANFFGALLRFDHGARHWLWTAERTGRFEKHASAVWVLTPDLYWDFQDDHYRELVHLNVTQRKVAYRYLYSLTEQNQARVEELRDAYAGDLGADQAAEAVKFTPVPEEEFLWCTEHVLFNPSTPQEAGLIVDICEDRDRSRKYDVLMGPGKRLAFRRQFQYIWARYSDEAIATVTA